MEFLHDYNYVFIEQSESLPQLYWRENQLKP